MPMPMPPLLNRVTAETEPLPAFGDSRSPDALKPVAVASCAGLKKITSSSRETMPVLPNASVRGPAGRRRMIGA